MIKVDEIERIRRAYHVEGKSMRQIEREFHHSRHTIKKALESAEAGRYRLKKPRAAPVLGPYKARIKELLAQNDTLPGKHRLTGHRIFKLVWEEGYRGSESGVLMYLWRLRQAKRQVKVFIPLEFEPGQDAQVDWGEAEVILAGEQVTIQLFVMRLCYSRFLGGIPQRLTYDNLKTAVKKIFIGSERQEQDSFIVFRSHYLFESHYCTPGAGHEKGRVEDGVGYARRNFMSPLLQAADFAELNEQLRQACLQDDERRVDRQLQTIAEAWQQEQPQLRPLPVHDLACCREVGSRLNGFSQVEVETNRYSVPTDRAAAKLRVKLYPFEVKIYRLDEKEAIAVHPRCYGQQQDILDPLHYLPLLEQRPGAFQHAKPVRQWRASWPVVYERLLAELQQRQPGGAGVRQFIRILRLHQQYPAKLIEQAVSQALQYQCPHADGVELCLRQLLQPEPALVSLDVSHNPKLQGVGQQPVSLTPYNQLLGGGPHGCQPTA
jgi:transposase